MERIIPNYPTQQSTAHSTSPNFTLKFHRRAVDTIQHLCHAGFMNGGEQSLRSWLKAICSLSQYRRQRRERDLRAHEVDMTRAEYLQALAHTAKAEKQQ